MNIQILASFKWSTCRGNKSFFSSLTKVIMQWAINKMNSIVEYPSSDSFGLPKITEWDLRLPDESFGPTKWPGEE